MGGAGAGLGLLAAAATATSPAGPAGAADDPVPVPASAAMQHATTCQNALRVEIGRDSTLFLPRSARSRTASSAGESRSSGRR